MAVAIFLVALLQCLPIEANWDPAVKANARCVDNSFHVSISCLNVLIDVLILVLLFWTFFWTENAHGGQDCRYLRLLGRPGVSAPFQPLSNSNPSARRLLSPANNSVIVVARIRLVAIYKLFYVPPNPNNDPFHDIGVVYNVVEVNIAIISASAPALRPMFRWWWPKLFGGITSGKTSGLKYYGNPSQSRNTARDGDGDIIALKDMHDAPGTPYRDLEHLADGLG